MGRGVADRGARAARGFGAPGSGVVRSGGAGADLGGEGAVGARAWPAVDLDGELCAVDDHQAAHWLGLRNACAGGLRLAAPAAVLFDRDRSACAGGVDGAQARSPAGNRGRGGDHEGGDRQGPARDAFSCAGGEDRLDGGGGGYPLPVRRDARVARRSGAGTRGQEAHGDDQGQDDAGHGSFAFGWAGCSCDLKDACASHWAGEGGGDEAQRACRAADCAR